LVLKQSDVVQFFGVICVQPSGGVFRRAGSTSRGTQRVRHGQL